MPTPTNRYYVTGAQADWFGVKTLTVTLTATGPFDDGEVRSLMNGRPVAILNVDTLAALLDGVLADDPQAIRDAARWLTVNRPAVDGGDTVGEGDG